MIHFLGLFLLGFASFATETTIFEGVSLQGHWVAQKDISDKNFRVFEGEISGQKARIISGIKPYYKTVTPQSKDLFRAFTDTYLRKAPIHWKTFNIQPEQISNYNADLITLKGLDEPAAMGWIPLADENFRHLLVLAFVFENTPLYLLWYPSKEDSRQEAYQKVTKIFHFKKQEAQFKELKGK